MVLPAILKSILPAPGRAWGVSSQKTCFHKKGAYSTPTAPAKSAANGTAHAFTSPWTGAAAPVNMTKGVVAEVVTWTAGLVGDAGDVGVAPAGVSTSYCRVSVLSFMIRV